MFEEFYVLFLLVFLCMPSNAYFRRRKKLKDDLFAVLGFLAAKERQYRRAHLGTGIGRSLLPVHVTEAGTYFELKKHADFSGSFPALVKRLGAAWN